jgi:hypothetical protein
MFYDLQGKIVQEATLSRDARKVLCKTISATMRTRKRLNLESSIELGEHLTELKRACKHGEWLPLLDQLGVARRQAQRSIAFAQKRHMSHLDDCESEDQAALVLGIPDGEEQEIAEDGTQATFGDEEQQATTTNGEEKPKTQRTIRCDACKRAQRVGMTIPRTCPECKKIAQEEKEFAKDPPKPATGGCSLASVGNHFKAVMRQMRNLAVDSGLQVKPDDLPAPMLAVREKLGEAKQIILDWRNELKARAKPDGG